MGEAAAGDRRGSLCRHLPGAGYPALRDLWPRDGRRSLIPEGEPGRAPWRRRTRSKTRGEETGCWRKSGRSWNCISGQSCWSSHCLCPGLYLGPGLCPGRGCSFCGCCCRRHGGCESGGGCGVSGGRGRLIGRPGCLGGSPCRPCVLSGDGSGGNGTLWKSLSLAGGGTTTFWSRSPPPRSARPSLCRGCGPVLTSGADRIGRQGVAEASRSGGPCAARALRHWGRGGSRAARWDGMMCSGGTWGDRGDTPKVPVHPRSSETLCTRRQ